MDVLKHRLNAAREADDVAVESLKCKVLALACDAYNINGAYGACLGAKLVDVAYHLLLVWNSDVKSFKLWGGGKYLG